VKLARHRARAPTASVETQWTKTLRSPWVLPPPPGRPATCFGSSKPGQLNSQEERYLAAGDASMGRRRPFQPHPPRRLAPISAWDGNEAGNPSYYPLPLGRHVFSSRWVPLSTQ